MTKHRARVLVAMSGGVDSSLAALLLEEQGYEVIGLTMKTWDYALTGRAGKETGCCSLDSINDAREVALSLGIPHYVTDIRASFKRDVIQYFSSEYLKGRTPNPCVMCNTHVKWDVLLQKANDLDCAYVATGHYASVTKKDDRYLLTRAKDTQKDQTYALWGLSQEVLARTIFPLATYTKPEIKQRAIEQGFSALAEKPESYEICFIPDNDYRSFLKRQVPNLDKKIGEGAFVLKDGTEVGRHEGYPFYTIGQRKGLGVALGYPAYVIDINKTHNQITLGKAEDLRRSRMQVRQLNWVKVSELHQSRNVRVHIRYNDKKGTNAQIIPTKEGVDVHFDTQVEAIAPGQAAVFYEDNELLGGGWIHKSFIDS